MQVMKEKKGNSGAKSTLKTPVSIFPIPNEFFSTLFKIIFQTRLKIPRISSFSDREKFAQVEGKQKHYKSLVTGQDKVVEENKSKVLHNK